MELQLKNIGMIKEANVKIDGLTVIAGENDTGKSTVGKALYLILHVLIDRDRNPKIYTNDNGRFWNYKSIKNHILPKIEIGTLKLLIDSEQIIYKDVYYEDDLIKKIDVENILFVETPLVWSFLDTFKSIAQIGYQNGIEVNYPYLMNDLAIKLSNNRNSKESKINISDKAKKIMQGDFKKDSMGIFFFEKDTKRVELINTATGIKYFGMLQILSDNGWLTKNTILLLDEPEVHLHPKWQLEMAKIIVELVKNGVKVVVNSHSPYMIEALKRYSDKEKLQDKTNFYLAEGGYIEDKNKLQEIYEKLSEPFDEFDKMDSDILNG